MKKIYLDEKTRDIVFYVFMALAMLSVLFIYAEKKFDIDTSSLEANDSIAPISGEIVEQTISDISGGYINAINISFNTNNRDIIGSLNVELLENDKLIKKWEIDESTITDNAYTKLAFDKLIKVNKNSQYSIIISENYEGENGVLVNINTDASNKLTYQHEEISGTICYTLSYRNVKLKVKFIIVAFLLMLLISILLLKRVKEIIIMSVMLFSLIVAYMFICPIGIAPDENAHLLRAYEISSGGMISKHLDDTGYGGDYLPSNILDYNNNDAVLDEKNTVAMPFSNTALYSPVNYIPQALGMKIVKLFSHNVRAIVYGGKIGNAFVAFILFVLTLYLAPFGKRIYFLLMTFPMTMQQTVSMSADTLTLAICLFFTSYVFNVAYKSEKIDKKNIIILACTGFVLSMLKIVYIVLVGLVFLIPNEKFSNKKKSYGIKFALIGTTIFCNLIWLKISSSFLVEYNPGVNSLEQVKFVLKNIISYYVVFVRTLLNHMVEWISCMIGSHLGAFNVGVTSVVWITALLLIIYEVLTCYEVNIKATARDYIVLIVTFLAGIALIATSLYVQWTPVGNEEINGIQGRYFTPIIIILAYFIIFSMNSKNNEIISVEKKKTRYLYPIILIYNGLALLDVANYYIASFS